MHRRFDGVLDANQGAKGTLQARMIIEEAEMRLRHHRAFHDRTLVRMPRDGRR
jgi:hypothetical protein